MCVVIAVLIVCLFTWTLSSAANESLNPLQRDVKMIREALEGPLQVDLEMRGLSTDDAIEASAQAMERLTSCCRTQQAKPNEGAEQTIVVRLGQSAIVTYSSPCMDEFLTLVGEQAR